MFTWNSRSLKYWQSKLFPVVRNFSASWKYLNGTSKIICKSFNSWHYWVLTICRELYPLYAPYSKVCCYSHSTHGEDAQKNNFSEIIRSGRVAVPTLDCLSPEPPSQPPHPVTPRICLWFHYMVGKDLNKLLKMAKMVYMHFRDFCGHWRISKDNSSTRQLEWHLLSPHCESDKM